MLFRTLLKFVTFPTFLCIFNNMFSGYFHQTWHKTKHNTKPHYEFVIAIPCCCAFTNMIYLQVYHRCVQDGLKNGSFSSFIIKYEAPTISYHLRYW